MSVGEALKSQLRQGNAVLNWIRRVGVKVTRECDPDRGVVGGILPNSDEQWEELRQAELATPRTPPYHQRMDPNRSLSVGAATVPTTGSPR
jgi:hypothetical protein